MQGKQKEREEEGTPRMRSRRLLHTLMPHSVIMPLALLADEMPLTGTRPAALGTVAVA